MKYIEFNVRYDVVGSGVIYLHYTLNDNGNATHGALSLREIHKGLWQGSMEVPAEYVQSQRTIRKRGTIIYAPFAAKALPLEVYQGDNHQLHLSLPGGQEPLLQRPLSAYRQEGQGYIRC